MMKLQSIFLLLFLTVMVSAKDRVYIQNSSLERKDKEAILILPGFGSKVHGTKDIAFHFFQGEKDVFIPDYLSRKSISKCVKNLDNFYKKMQLSEYRKVHIFSYIVGSWTINQWIATHSHENISSIIYDRSPWQERAPFALVEDIPVLIRLLSGPIMKEFANTPYSPMADTNIQVGILIESKATKLIHKHKKSALKPGPIHWEVDSLHQFFDDFNYIFLNHDDFYSDLKSIAKEVNYFSNHGKFSPEAQREKFNMDPFIEFNNDK